jgi:hypothetical protein
LFDAPFHGRWPGCENEGQQTAKLRLFLPCCTPRNGISTLHANILTYVNRSQALATEADEYWPYNVF